MDECPYYLVNCPESCGARVARCNVDLHMTQACPHRLVRCDRCGANIQALDFGVRVLYCQDIVRGTEREGGRWGGRERERGGRGGGEKEKRRVIYCQDIVRGTEREGGRWGGRERVGGGWEREGERKGV